MSTRKSLLAQVHIAKKDLGLDDDAYQDFLHSRTGHTSAGKLSEPQLIKIVDAFKAIGWKSKKSKTSFRPKSNKSYVRLIYVFWGKLVNAGVTNKDGLNGFVKSQTDKDSVEWLNSAQGNQIIETLKSMAKREGVSLER